MYVSNYYISRLKKKILPDVVSVGQIRNCPATDTDILDNYLLLIHELITNNNKYNYVIGSEIII